MLLRIFLIALIIALIIALFLRFVSGLFRAILMHSTTRDSSEKKSRRDIDDSQIQDADFKDL